MGNSAKSCIGWLVTLLISMAWCSCASCHFEAVSFMTFYKYMYHIQFWGLGEREIYYSVPKIYITFSIEAL